MVPFTIHLVANKVFLNFYTFGAPTPCPYSNACLLCFLLEFISHY